jgi:transcription antitermination factor NusG
VLFGVAVPAVFSSRKKMITISVAQPSREIWVPTTLYIASSMECPPSTHDVWVNSEMNQNCEQFSGDIQGSTQPSTETWYAVQTRNRHEKKVAAQLLAKNILAFVPTVRQLHMWSDRKKLVDVPLFSCYAFVNAPDKWHALQLAVLSTPGVLRWVGVHGQPAAIPQAQIDAIRSIVNSGIATSPYPFLKLGQRVRIRGGSLDGLEGILVKNEGIDRLVVSIDLIQQSVSVSLNGYQVVAA